VISRIYSDLCKLTWIMHLCKKERKPESPITFVQLTPLAKISVFYETDGKRRRKLKWTIKDTHTNIMQTSLLPECQSMTSCSCKRVHKASYRAKATRDSLRKVFPDFITAQLSGSILVSVVPILQPEEENWRPFWFSWDILQERVHEGRVLGDASRMQGYMNLRCLLYFTCVL